MKPLTNPMKVMLIHWSAPDDDDVGPQARLILRGLVARGLVHAVTNFDGDGGSWLLTPEGHRLRAELLGVRELLKTAPILCSTKHEWDLGFGQGNKR